MLFRSAPSPVEFALQELTAIWNQGYEALAQGNLDHLAGLIDLADEYTSAAGDGRNDSESERCQRDLALEAKGRLEHGMRTGMQVLQDELARSRIGARVLRGYADPTLATGNLRLQA